MSDKVAQSATIVVSIKWAVQAAEAYIAESAEEKILASYNRSKRYIDFSSAEARDAYIGERIANGTSHSFWRRTFGLRPTYYEANEWYNENLARLKRLLDLGYIGNPFRDGARSEYFYTKFPLWRTASKMARADHVALVDIINVPLASEEYSILQWYWDKLAAAEAAQ